MKDIVIQFLRRLNGGAITPELELYLFRHLKIEEVEKNEILLDKGEVCDKVWFVIQGLFRSYRKHGDGNRTSGSWVRKM